MILTRRERRLLEVYRGLTKGAQEVFLGEVRGLCLARRPTAKRTGKRLTAKR